MKIMQLLLGILKYLSKFSPVTAKVCKPLQKLMLVKADLAWNRMYQDLCDKAKMIIKKNTCVDFFDASRLLYLELTQQVLVLEPDYCR